MATFLLTWTTALWPKLSDAAKQTATGIPFHKKWSCGNTKRIRKGDRVFLLKQGKEPKGIMGAGVVVCDEPYLEPHWIPAKASKGEKALTIDVDFERLLAPDSEPLLSVLNLQSQLLALVHWNTAKSGIEVKGKAADELDALWKQHLASSALAVQPVEEQQLLESPLGQGFQADPHIKKAVEQYAMERAIAYYKKAYHVTDTSKTEPYDLQCFKNQEEVRVEVKGTSTLGEVIFLTRNEVEHVRHAPCRVDLFVVSGIVVHKDAEGQLQCTGGVVSSHIEGWVPEDKDLVPIQYRYNLPQSKKVPL